MTNRKFGYLVAAIFVLLAVFHRQLIGWIDVDGFWFLVFFVAVFTGRLNLYVYRKSPPINSPPCAGLVGRSGPLWPTGSSRKNRMQQAIVHRTIVILMGVAFIGLDQWVKALALVGLDHQSFYFGGSRIGLEIALSLNPGAFLSLGAELSPHVKQLIFVAGVGVVVCWAIGWALSKWTASTGKAAAVYLIALGGASNLIDRIYREGQVVDYLFVNLGPVHTGVFNIADIAIVVGALALVFVGSTRQGRFR